MGATRTVKIKIASWSRFRSEGLAVAPEVLGCTHHFEFEGKRVEMRLPREEDLTKEKGYGTLVECWAWYKDGTPLFYDILKVDVVIDIPEEVELEEELVSRSARRENLTTPSKVKFLDQMVDEHEFSCPQSVGLLDTGHTVEERRLANWPIGSVRTAVRVGHTAVRQRD